MPMTHRSELVDKVTNALMDEAYDGGMGPMSETEFPRHVRRLAETALEVVTSATEEDREALAKVSEQIAMFTQKHDAIRYGSVVDGVAHPTWEELGPDAAAEYRADAERTVRAMVALGWGSRRV